MAAASAGRGGFGEAGEGGAGKERGGSREAHHEAAPLPRSAVDRLDDVDHLLLVGDRPVDFVVVTRSKVNHDVLCLHAHAQWKRQRQQGHTLAAFARATLFR